MRECPQVADLPELNISDFDYAHYPLYRALHPTQADQAVEIWRENDGSLSIYITPVDEDWPIFEVWPNLDLLTAQSVLYHLWNARSDGTPEVTP